MSVTRVTFPYQCDVLQLVLKNTSPLTVIYWAKKLSSYWDQFGQMACTIPVEESMISIEIQIKSIHSSKNIR